MRILRVREHVPVRLAETPKPPTPAQLSTINRLPGVLMPLNADDVTVLRTYLVNDQPFKDGRRVIRSAALTQIAKLMPGVKVAMNHDVFTRDATRALGRSIDAEVVREDGASWVVVSWYTLNGGTTGEVVREVLGGLITEASIAMLCSVCECSICGGNWGMCKHYEQAGQKVGGKRCLAELDGVERVMEWSYVFSGMVEGTHFRVAASEGEEGELAGVVDLEDLEKAVTVPPGVYTAEHLEKMIEALATMELTEAHRVRLGEILAAAAARPPRDPWVWLRGKKAAA